MSLAPSLGTFSGYFANGGDATPGSRFISGESGAEEVDLDGRGGAHITPASGATAGGGDSHHYYDMRGAVVTDDLMTKAQAAASFRASEGRMMGAIPTLAREMSLRQR
jgi:hypothetical protein